MTNNKLAVWSTQAHNGASRFGIMSLSNLTQIRTAPIHCSQQSTWIPAWALIESPDFMREQRVLKNSGSCLRLTTRTFSPPCSVSSKSCPRNNTKELCLSQGARVRRNKKKQTLLFGSLPITSEP